MCVAPMFPWNRLLQPELDFLRRLAHRETQSIRHTKNMGIHCNRRISKRDTHHDICRLSPDAG